LGTVISILPTFINHLAKKRLAADADVQQAVAS